MRLSAYARCLQEWTTRHLRSHRSPLIHMCNTHTNQSCHICKRVTSHIRTSHVTRMNACTSKCALPPRMDCSTLVQPRKPKSCSRPSRRKRMSSSTDLSKPSLMASWLCSYVRHDSFICVTWLIYMCDMTHLYVRHDSFICVTRRSSSTDLSKPSLMASWLCSYVRHDSFIYVQQDSSICVS